MNPNQQKYNIILNATYITDPEMNISNNNLLLLRGKKQPNLLHLFTAHEVMTHASQWLHASLNISDAVIRSAIRQIFQRCTTHQISSHPNNKSVNEWRRS